MIWFVPAISILVFFFTRFFLTFHWMDVGHVIREQSILVRSHNQYITKYPDKKLDEGQSIGLLVRLYHEIRVKTTLGLMWELISAMSLGSFVWNTS